MSSWVYRWYRHEGRLSIDVVSKTQLLLEAKQCANNAMKECFRDLLHHNLLYFTIKK